MGFIKLVFQALGTIPQDKEALKIIHNTRDRIKLQDLKKIGGILSEPGLVNISRLLSLLQILPILI